MATRLVFALLCTGFSGPALAMGTCAPYASDPMEGFAPLDPVEYLDIPNSDTMSAAFGLELELVGRLHAQEFRQLTKTYCNVGIQQVIIDFSYPVEDDSVSDWIMRTVFVWDATSEPVGWRLERLGERGRCARGDDPFAPVCP